MRPFGGLRGRLPSLRFILILVSLGSMILPVILVGAIVTLTQGRVSEGPIVRALVAVREVPRAVDLDRADRLVLRPGYASPAWLDLVIVDLSDAVVFSTIPSIVPGAHTGLSAMASIAEVFVPKAAFLSDAVEIRGRTVGTWFAILPSDAARSLAGETGPLFHLTGYAFIATFAFLFGLVVAGVLASQMARLEKAAIAIASGDLETPVTSRGAREIVRLAEAMERMRNAIREDLARRSRFLAAVSHDLRTPLTTIGGYLEAIEDGLASDPETLGRYVSVMKEKTALLDERIGGLIEFARMETGEWRLGFETLALKPLFESFAREAEAECALAGSTLVTDLSALGDIEAEVDRGLLSRAFENLISNALRHGKEGGQVTVVAERSMRGTRRLLVAVCDEGSGILPADREHAFEPFWKGSGAREGEGSGLGLYIARSVLRGHGWELEAQGSASGGRFVIGIPLLRVDETEDTHA
ncbi:MAG: HAMP domain-containing sensor histidine kinase [Spirochaetota bacterium]